jgi:molecular chaperone DnaK
MTVIGIDLGTTHSEVCFLKDGEPTMIAISGSALVPSVVSQAADGRLLVGRAALNNELAAPQDTVRWIKRLMGTDRTVALGGKTWTPAMISSLILRHLKEAAEEQLHSPVGQAVVTVPAFFSERAREDTREAARLAGLEVLRLVNESTAAAAAYARGNRRDERWLVYDLGGGTFDVSIVACAGEVLEVLASHGDVLLGGHDFDRELARRASEDFLKRHGLDLAQQPRAWARLLRAAEAAKIQLSSDAEAVIREEHIATISGRDLHLEYAVRRTDFEAQIAPAIERTLSSVRQALAMAGCDSSAISRVLLVGGVTRTPLVQRLLREELGIEPQAWINPDTVVAQGAAIEAAAMAGERVSAALVDITPHSIGVGALDAFLRLRNHILVRRNTPLPSTASQVFYKHDADQEAIDIDIFQGESEIPERNQRIGTFRLDQLGHSQSREVHCRFDIDRSGLLQVSISDLGSGKSESRVIERPRAVQRADLANLATVRLDAPEEVGEDEHEDAWDGVAPDESLPLAGASIAQPGAAPAAEDSDGAGGADSAIDPLIAQAGGLLARSDLDPADREELTIRLAGITAGDAEARARLSDLVYFLS